VHLVVKSALSFLVRRSRALFAFFAVKCLLLFVA
jgi:hypothetical protein